jgi:hypothetical protein
MADFAGCLVTATANQSIPNSAYTAITFDSEIYDVSDYHSSVVNPSRITIPAGGAAYYQIYGLVKWDANATGERLLVLRLNGADLITLRRLPVAAFDMTQFFSVVYPLSVTNYVELFVLQSSGGALNSERTAAPYAPFFGVARIGV